MIIALAYDQLKSLVKDAQHILVKGREGLSTASLERLENNALTKAVSVAVVTHYTQEVASLFPRMIQRAELLRVLPAQDTVPKKVQQYLEEASKCYVYGRFIACLIVCRSAIDFALRERLTNLSAKSQCTGGQDVSGDLSTIIERARTVLPLGLKGTLDDADCVRLKANDAVHKSTPKAETCKLMFIKTRGILRELYSLPAN